MTRIVKAPDERRSELIACAQELFYSKGYEGTSVRDIVEVCEGGIALNHCLRRVNRCKRAEDCNIAKTWEKAQAALVQALEETRLSDIV